MKKNKLALISLILCLATSLCACSGTGSSTSDTGSGSNTESDTGSEKPTPVTYDTYGSYWMRQHSDTVMPVGAYNSCPNMSTSGYTYSYIEHEQTFKDYADAGVNVMMGLYEYTASDEVYQALEWCEKYNLAYLVRFAGGDHTTLSTAKATLTRAKYYEAFAGVMQTDEPGRTAFENIKKSAEYITSVIPEEYRDECLMHVNLFPDYATQKQLYNRVNDGEIPEGGYTYDEYLEDFISITSPRILSYDNYPLSGGEEVIQGYSYFKNMATIRKYALRENLPFWTFIQTCSFSNSTRIPNEAELLWQVNTALSYGAKGIQYFCGVNPSDGGETFKGSMFDRDGNKTEVYNHVKVAGTQIRAVDEVLMHCKSQGVMLVGEVPYSTKKGTGIPDSDLLEKYGVVEGVEGSHSFIGCFDYDGKPAYYITNNSIIEDEQVTLLFNGNMKGYIVARGNKSKYEAAKISLSLNPGEGVLVVVE